MNPIGINGFGRIGKCIFLLLLKHEFFYVAAINAPGMDIHRLESYLKNDSVHKYGGDFIIEIVDNDNFKINGHLVHIFRDRNAENLRWKDYNIDTLIDATGAYLTKEKVAQHNVERVIMTAPPKDDTPLFVHGANHETYRGENVVSNASCTTNCITPVLAFLEKKYNIVQSNFTTIHASTSSQHVVDTAHSKSRTCRSIFNNIIPHTTGASSSIFKVLPSMTGKITGTSVRVPVNNVSLVDLNVELGTETSLKEIMEGMSQCPYIELCKENLVSSDFLTTTCPSIVDVNACMELGRNNFKFMVWYDNEWSYSNQVIKMVESMVNYKNENKYFIDNVEFTNKNVLIRVDYNVPIQEGVVTSDHRITASIPTIKKILQSHPNRLIIMSHLGRPKGYDETCSLSILTKILEEKLSCSVGFLKDGLSPDTLTELDKNEYRVYILENLRFHPEETDKTTRDENNVAYQVMRSIGDIYVNDAFGCLHRDHLSITGMSDRPKAYGYLIQDELKALQLITKNPYKQKVMAIVGGGKIDDKLELLKELSAKVDTIYVCGGNINALIKSDMTKYYETISSKKARIVLMEDGLAAANLSEPPKSKYTKVLDNKGKYLLRKQYGTLNDDESFLDIGQQSLITLDELISQHSIVFWNGTLGVVENERYASGSTLLLRLLHNSSKHRPNQKIIIGGGDTGGFVKKFDQYIDTITHISTGGGASIEYITHDNLVGLNQFSKES